MYTDLWGIVFIQLLVFEDLEVPTHKTKNIVNYFQQMEDTKKLLLVDGSPINEKLKLATQNLHYVNVLPSIVSFSFIHVASLIVQMEVTIITLHSWYLLKFIVCFQDSIHFQQYQPSLILVAMLPLFSFQHALASWVNYIWIKIACSFFSNSN